MLMSPCSPITWCCMSSLRPVPNCVSNPLCPPQRTRFPKKNCRISDHSGQYGAATYPCPFQGGSPIWSSPLPSSQEKLCCFWAPELRWVHGPYVTVDHPLLLEAFSPAPFLTEPALLFFVDVFIMVLIILGWLGVERSRWGHMGP